MDGTPANFVAPEVKKLDIHKSKYLFFEQGDRNGRFLALLAQHDTPLTIILEIKTNEGSVVTSLDDILNEFRSFYNSLYTSSLPPSYNPVDMHPLWDTVARGWLTDAE